MLRATRPVDTSRCMAEAGAAHSFAEQAKTEPRWGFFATLFYWTCAVTCGILYAILDAGRSLGTMQQSGERQGRERKGEDAVSKRLSTGVGQWPVDGWWRQASGNQNVQFFCYVYGLAVDSQVSC